MSYLQQLPGGTNNQYGFWDGWHVLVCACVQQKTHGTFTCYVQASLEGQGNYSRHRGFILGVCCVIVSPSYLPCSTWSALCGCARTESSVFLRVHWTISWNWLACLNKGVWQPSTVFPNSLVILQQHGEITLTYQNVTFVNCWLLKQLKKRMKRYLYMSHMQRWCQIRSSDTTTSFQCNLSRQSCIRQEKQCMFRKLPVTCSGFERSCQEDMQRLSQVRSSK